MRLTDLPSKIPMLDALGIEDPNIPLDEIMAIGAGLSAAAAVMWVMSHPEAPILSKGMERSQQSTELFTRMNEAIAEGNVELIDSIANLIKSMGPMALLTP